MERPRLSIASDSSSYGSESEDRVSLPTPTAVCALPPVILESMLVQGSHNTGVLNGDVTNVTVNIGVVPGGESWDPEAVQDLVTDAVKIHTETSQQCHPNSKTKDELLRGNKEVLRSLQKRWCCLITVLVSLSFVTLLSTSLFSLALLRGGGGPTTVPPIENTTLIPESMPGAPRIVSRVAWLAQPPVGRMFPNVLPATRVIVCHTASEFCINNGDCVQKVRLVQEFQVESRGFTDIAYNFLVGGDGSVYEGRGWDIEGAHTYQNNRGTLGVAFVGTYIAVMPNEKQLVAFRKLLDVSVRLGKLAADYLLQVQCQLRPTAAPGLVLAQNISSWPHFDHSLPIKCSVPETKPEQ